MFVDQGDSSLFVPALGRYVLVVNSRDKGHCSASALKDGRILQLREHCGNHCVSCLCFHCLFGAPMVCLVGLIHLYSGANGVESRQLGCFSWRYIHLSCSPVSSSHYIMKVIYVLADHNAANAAANTATKTAVKPLATDRPAAPCMPSSSACLPKVTFCGMEAL